MPPIGEIRFKPWKRSNQDFGSRNLIWAWIWASQFYSPNRPRPIRPNFNTWSYPKIAFLQKLSKNPCVNVEATSSLPSCLQTTSSCPSPGHARNRRSQQTACTRRDRGRWGVLWNNAMHGSEVRNGGRWNISQLAVKLVDRARAEWSRSSSVISCNGWRLEMIISSGAGEIIDELRALLHGSHQWRPTEGKKASQLYSFQEP